MSEARSRQVFVILAVVAFVTIVGLGLGMTFFADEWAFIERRSLTDPSTWWPPHNEHWTTLSVLVYRLMVETIGIGTYVPYLLVVAALHVVVAALVYRLLERSSGPVFALIGGAIVLFFGSGFENLYWGFQMNIIGSIAFGLGAMLVTDGPATMRRAVAVAALLLASLACSGMGIVMSLAVGLEWLLTPRWRRAVPILLAPAGTYAVWYLLAGRAGVDTFRDPVTVEAILDVPRSVIQGSGNALGSAVGLPGLGLGLFVAFLGSAGIAFRYRALTPRVVAIGVAIAAQYALIGLVRAQLFEGIINYSRYTYVSGILAIVAIGALVGRVRIPTSGHRRLGMMFVLGTWAAVALVCNIGLLVLGRELFLDRAGMTRALVTVAIDPGRPVGVDLDRSLVLVPSPAALDAITDAYGDPRSDRWVPWAVRPIPPEVLAEARRRLIEGAPLPLAPSD